MDTCHEVKMLSSTNTSIYKRLIGVFILIIVGSFASLIFFYNSYSNSLENEKKAQSKYLSEVGIGIIEHFYQLSSSGSLTLFDAKNLAMSVLQSATYEDNGYFWINSGEGTLLMQPFTPDRVGINQTDWTDINGQHIFQEYIKKAKAGGGWVSYYWPKPHSNEEHPKISYVSYFEPWNWVLGTGVYLDDMRKNIRRTIINTSGSFLAVFIVFFTLAFLLVNVLVRQLEKLSVRDHLTNLYTKRFLDELLPTILSKHQREKNLLLAVIFIDIDHFKNINDQYGHKYGDEVLTDVAQMLVSKTRPSDFCIRFGGEEFLIVGQFANKKSIVDCAERIRGAVSLIPFKNKNIQFQLTVSAGIAIYNDSEESFDDTMKRADKMLYRSKDTGRNRVSI